MITLIKRFNVVLILVLSLLTLGNARAANPQVITIGTLYAGSGPLAPLSLSVYSGLKYWAESANAAGGVYVKAYAKKVPVKLVAYDDLGNPATAGSFYNRLITQDKVDILVADSTSILTAPAVELAKNHKVFLFNQSGTGDNFFTKENRYIALTSDPVASEFPRYLINFLKNDGSKLGIKKIALIYATNDFTGAMGKAITQAFSDKIGPQIVYTKEVPTQTNDYSVIINELVKLKPDAVIELGYVSNDVTWFKNMAAVGAHFPMMFAIYPGLELEHMVNTVSPKSLGYTYTYTTPATVNYKVTAGDSLSKLEEGWKPIGVKNKMTFGNGVVNGYTTGVVIQEALTKAKSLDGLDLNTAVHELSGNLVTVGGPFKLNAEGAQIGEVMPLAQLTPAKDGGLHFTVVYPSDVANGNAMYPAPQMH